MWEDNRRISNSPRCWWPELEWWWKRWSNSDRLEKSHSSALAWKIPWAEKPGRLQPMGSLRVGHNWATSLSLFTFMHWRRKWQPTPVFLPGESQGQGSLVGCCLWGSHRVGHDWSNLAAAARTTGNIVSHILWAVLQILKAPPAGSS